jgi:hypothetical protein
LETYIELARTFPVRWVEEVAIFGNLTVADAGATIAAGFSGRDGAKKTII